MPNTPPTMGSVHVMFCDRKHGQKTQKTQKKNTDRKHREKTQTENTERKHRQKTHRQKTETHREKAQTEVLHNPTKYHSATQYSIPRCQESSPGPPASKATALSTRQIFWDNHIQKIVISNTMRGAILHIQNTNVHTARPMRGAIPRAHNLRFATVSRDRPTES